MYFQFLIEDKSTEILVDHVIDLLKKQYPNAEIEHDCKSFKGIGALQKFGTIQERKSGKLLNDLAIYLKGFDKSLASMKKVAIVIVLDNDENDPEKFRASLNRRANELSLSVDHVFCIAVKEMEAWLLGDRVAIMTAYPNAKIQLLSKYTQDQIDDTWEILADIVYPKGLHALRKKADGAYGEIGKAKGEWADKIGKCLDLTNNLSPSFNYFIQQLTDRIDIA